MLSSSEYSSATRPQQLAAMDDLLRWVMADLFTCFGVTALVLVAIKLAR